MKKRVRKWPLVSGVVVFSGLILGRLINDLSRAGSSAEEFWGDSAWILLGLVFLGIAAIILLKSRNNIMGWVLLGPALGAALDSAGNLLYGPLAEMPNSLSVGQTLFVWFSGAGWWLLIGPIFLISLIYPDGKLPGKLQRIGLRMLVITFGLFLIFASFSEYLENVENAGQLWPNPVGFIPIEISENFFSIFAVLLILTTLICLASIFNRYRGSSGVERAQMKWLFYAMSLFLVVYIITALLQNTDEDFSQALNIAFLFTIILIPIAIGIAIMRYRLWDIDLVINRSLVYGLLTAIIAAVWAGSLTVIDQLISSLVGDTSKAASTVLSTLLAASIVQPARARIEKWINKRIFPEKRQLEIGFIEIEPRFWGHLDITKIAQLTVERVCGIMQAPRGAFMVRTNKDAFIPVASYGITRKDIQAWKPDAKELKDLQEERAATWKENPEFNTYVPLFIPRVGPNEVLGLLALSLRKNGRGYSGDELKALTKLGAKLGEALYSLELENMK